MAIDLCPACGCCNHCDSRHVGNDESDRCPLDPDLSQEEVCQMLRDSGISDEEQAAGLSRVMASLDLVKERNAANTECERLRESLRMAGFCLAEGWQPFDVQKAHGIIDEALAPKSKES